MSKISLAPLAPPEERRTFSRAYWREAIAELTDLRKLCMAALIIAVAVLLKPFKIPLSGSLAIGVSFIASAVGGAVLGPILSLIRGVASDIVGWMCFPDGDFAIGYTLTEAVAAMLYSFAFWRKKITLGRILSVRLAVNLLINGLVGSLWTHIYFGLKYGAALAASLAKNILLMPAEIAVTALLFNAICPPLARMNLLPAQKELRIGRKYWILVGVFAFVLLVLLLLPTLFPDSVFPWIESVFTAFKKWLRSIFAH